MPVLHQYGTSAGYYAKSNIKGAIVTFQLTEAGQRKLLDLGLGAGSKFPLHLLVDLVRLGDAYTGGSGVESLDISGTSQLTFDFPEDEQAEKLLPACSVTGSFDDLHLVVSEQNGTPTAQLLSPTPRREVQEQISLSIPLSLLNKRALNQLLLMGKVPDGAVIESLRRWFDEDATAFWERWRQHRANKPQQLGLIDTDEQSLFSGEAL